MTEWEQDLFESTTRQLHRIARSLGVIVEVESEDSFRFTLASMPVLNLEVDEQGVLEVTPIMIADDCLDEIDELKTMIVLMNRLLITGDTDSEEARGAIEATTSYIQRMQNFPIRS